MATIYSPKPGCIGLISVKVGRNTMCMCGSGKKQKKCCGVETKYHNRDFESIDDLKKRLEFWENEKRIIENHHKSNRMSKELEKVYDKIKVSIKQRYF